MKLFVKRKPIEYIIYSAIILCGIFLDQLTKFLVSKDMYIGESIPIIQDFLHITYSTNPGMAFGMMGDESLRWIFMVISIVAILGFMAYLYLGHADNMLGGIAMAMVISGGLGNMIDRCGIGFYVNPETGIGEVVDFIDFRGIWNAIFNGADSFVCVGAGLLILSLLIELKKEYEKEKAKKAENADIDE